MTVLVVYFGILCFPAFFQTTGPFTDSHRPGWIAVAQLPFLFAFSVKNNALGTMFGTGYEKLNYLHRFLGKIIVLAINIHAIGYIYKWCFESQFKEKIATLAYSWGLVGLICIDGLYVLSVPWLRENAYHVFMTSHILCVVLLLLAMFFHKPALMPWVVICTIIYGVDRLLRLVKTRYTVATITPIPSLGVTRLECPTLTSGWRAGQHVRLQVLSSGMGVFGWSEVHPFTIASAPNGQGLVLLCKKAGDWTRKLYDIASTQKCADLGLDVNVKVLVEGPYGGPGHTMIASFSSAVFICGGSGISLGVSSVEDLVLKDARSASRVKTVELVWLVQDSSCLYPFLPQFVSLLEKTTTPLRISVYYTRPCAVKTSSTQFFPSGLCMSAGRPHFGHILETAIRKTLHPGLGGKLPERATGMVVGVCGPTSLADDVSKAVGTVDAELKDQVGGVEIYEKSSFSVSKSFTALTRVFGW